MGKPLRIVLSLNTIANSERRAGGLIRTENGECEKFEHCTARRSLARVPLLAESKTYRVIFHQQSSILKNNGHDVLLRKSSHQNENLNVELPGYRSVEDLEPLRATPRLIVEVCTDEVYLKRHEKHERQEKFIKRRDRIRQREEQYRLHLMKMEKSDAGGSPKITAVEVVEKMPRISQKKLRVQH